MMTLAYAFAAGAAAVSGDGENFIADAVARAAPAVVKLYGAATGREHGYGVGVLVSGDGQIVTVSGVLVEGRRTRAVLSDGRGFSAAVVREDERRHLALLKIDGRGLPFLVPHPSDHVQPADTVLALGNAYKVAEGDEPLSVHVGVFSLRTNLRAYRRMQPFSYDGPVLLYDTVTANPGMAGGPLLDADGKWIGLVGKPVVAERTNTMLSFALPAEEIAAFLRDSGSPAGGGKGPPASAPGAVDVQRPAYSGITLFDMGLRYQAAYIDRVASGSPAAAAGLRADDLILAMNGSPVRSSTDFRRRLAACAAGTRVTLTVKRGQEVVTVDLTLEEPR